MQAILTINPEVFFLLSGTGQAKYYPGMHCAAEFFAEEFFAEEFSAGTEAISRLPSVLMQCATRAECQISSDSESSNKNTFSLALGASVECQALI